MSSVEWTFKESELLRIMFKNGCSDEQIASIIGRTPSAINKYRSTIGLVKLTHGGGCNHYTEEEDTIIREGVASNKTDREVALILGNRTAESIATRRLTLGLVEHRHQATSPYALKVASIRHLIDLKRAGHSPTKTELHIPSEGIAKAVIKTAELFSYTGSQASMCAGA